MPSLAAQKAIEKIEQKRAELARIRAQSGAAVGLAQIETVRETAVSGSKWRLENGRRELEARRAAAGIAVLDPFAGSGTTAAAAECSRANIGETAVEEETAVEDDSHLLKVYPFLWCAANKRKEQAIFKLKTLLDDVRKNKSFVTVDQIKSALVETAVCTWDHISRRLNEGNGLYWTYNKAAGEVWFYGAHVVALNLGLSRGDIDHPVNVPKPKDLGSLERFNVVCYEAWLTSINHTGENPISRKLQSQLTGLHPRTLRKYTKISCSVEREANYSRVGDWNKETIEGAYFKHETAVFEFTDYQGKQGPAGRKYAVKENPSTYRTGFAIAGKNRRKRIRRKFRGLAVMEELRNGKRTFDRLYYETGKEAARAVSKGKEAYWKMLRGRSPYTQSAYQFWGMFVPCWL